MSMRRPPSNVTAKSDQSMFKFVQTDSKSLPSYEDLSPMQKDVADLGIDPNALNPIQELNRDHYKALIEQNKLSPDLVRQIESYSALAEAEQK